jgi:hypothetical protein
MAEVAQSKKRLAHQFDPAKAREAQARSVESRRARKAAEAARVAQIDGILATLDRQQLEPIAFASAIRLAQACVAGDIPIPESALERKRLAETAVLLHQMARLEAGESTSNSVTLTGDLADLDARRAELLSRLQAHSTPIDVDGG